MSFLDRIFGKKKKEAESLPQNIEFNRLPDVINEEYKKELDSLRAPIGEKYREINSSIKDIRNARQRLLEAEAMADANKRAEKLGESNRDNVIHNLDLVIEKIHVPSNKDPKDAFDFYEDSKTVLKQVLENTQRSMLYIKALYPREFENVGSSLAGLESRIDELYSLIKDEKEKIEIFDKFPEQIESIRRQEREIEEIQGRIIDLEEKYESSKQDVADIGSRMEELKGSDEFENARNLENKIKELDDNISITDSEIRRLFTPMSKAISRVEKQDKKEIHVLSPGNRNTLETIKNNPSAIGETELGSFLDMLEQRIKNRDLGLKEQMYDKILRQIEKLKETSVMADLLEQRESYLSEKKAVTDELNQLDVYQKMENIETQESQYRDSIGQILSRIEAERNHLQDIEDNLESSKHLLNSEIKTIFGQDAEIIYS